MYNTFNNNENKSYQNSLNSTNSLQEKWEDIFEKFAVNLENSANVLHILADYTLNLRVEEVDDYTIARLHSQMTILEEYLSNLQKTCNAIVLASKKQG